MKFSQQTFQPTATETTQALSKSLKSCLKENEYLKRQLTLYKALLIAKAETITLLREQIAPT